MSRYLDIARRTTTREGHYETEKVETPKQRLAFPARDEPRTSDHDPNESYERPNTPMPEGDKSDESDKSPSYQAVLEIFRDPPYWLKGSYMTGYQRGTVTLFTLSAAVAAALGRSPYHWTEWLMPLVERALLLQRGSPKNQRR